MKDILKEIDQLRQKINSSINDRLRDHIKEYYRIGLTYTSNAIEGNSLTETETKVILEEGITIGGKRLVEHLEAIGHSDAYNFMYTLVNNTIITEDDMRQLHRLFYYRIDEKNAGVYRNEKIYITGSQYSCPLPAKIPPLMEKLIPTLADMRKQKHPVEVAALAHKDFVFIHPFIDGNGRTSRLLMNLVLLQEGYTIAIIPPIMRHEYFRALEKAHVDDHDFSMFIARVVKETQRDYLHMFM